MEILPSEGTKNSPCDQIYRAWEEPSFSDTQHDTADDQACEILYDTGEGHHDSP
jgi:hypothetical protein